MTVLFGHPTGNPNSHHAALAHFEAGRLEAFCVSWMPSRLTTRVLQRLPRVAPLGRRLARRNFDPLRRAPKIQGRIGELRRLAIRAAGRGDEGLAYEANDWLMDVMSRNLDRESLTAVHAYEDCSLLQFQAAKRKGMACVYDMPIGYYGAWERISETVMTRFSGWIPEGGVSESRHVRPEQKAEELRLADLVLAPSAFVAETILEHRPGARIAIAPYGVDAERWNGGSRPPRPDGPLRFLFVGQCSIRKGVPLLIEAWKAAGLTDARLDLVGSWSLRQSILRDLPPGVSWTPPVGQDTLADVYRGSDVFVFPTFFEGRALVMGEAMASGLPVITTRASGAEDLVSPANGHLVDAGSLEELVESLRWFAAHREDLPAMGAAARAAAAACTWQTYRRAVKDAVGAYA